jgi:cold shock CspA family protein
MQGTIRSYVAEKRFGFITGDDDNSYFFHLDSLATADKARQISDGALVSFDPMPTPKGLAARKVVIEGEPLRSLAPPDRFIVVKAGSELRRGEIIAITQRDCTVTGDSPDAAREKLISLSQSLGATALLGARYHRGTGSSGNYRYTIHHYSGAPAVVMDPRPTRDANKVAESKKAAERAASAFLQNCEAYHERVRQEEAAAARVRLQVTIGAVAFIAAIALFILTH